VSDDAVKESKLSIVLSTAVRVLAMSLGALALGWGVTLTEGLGASVLGAAGGVVMGELLARSRMKLSAILAGAFAALLASWGLSKFATGFELFPSMLGPAGALTMAVLLRFGALVFTGTLALRALASRRKNLVVLELAALSGAVVTVFATHRDGVLVRPLWLSDWAWSVGLEPVQVLLGVGVGSVTTLAVLLIVQNRGSRALSALVALVALGLLAIMTVNAVGLPAPTPENDLGLLTPPGEPPRQQPPRDAGEGPNGSGDDAGESEGGQGEDAGEGEGGAGSDASGDGPPTTGAGDGSADGGASGGRDGSADGGSSSGMDSGADGGSSAMGLDAGDGGSSGGSRQDGGDASSGMPEGGWEDVPISPSSYSEGGEGGSGTPPPRPPSEDLENERQQQQQQRSAPMAVVLLDDDYDPPSQAFYLRQVTWSQFNGTRLVPTTRADADRDIPQGYPTEAFTLPERPPASGRTVVHHLVALVTEHNNPFGIEGAYRFEPARNPNPSRFVRAYRVESLAQTIEYRQLRGRRAGNPRWTPEMRAYYLEGPTDPRYRRLADSIVERIPQTRRNDPFSRAVAIKLWLDDNLSYTTRARHAEAADPTADMLWGNKKGYCVHFAHAAVFLWRSVGVPSRIGSGYHVDAQNRGSSSTVVVRSSDGHAWPEVFIEGVGWVVLDIAAKRNEDPPGQPQDEDERDRLGQMAREQPSDPEQPPQRPQQQPQRNRAREMAQAAAKAFPWLMLAALLALYFVKLWRRAVPAFAKGAALARVGYRAALDALCEAGLVREYGETREAFSRRVAERVPSLATLANEAERVKLGGPSEQPPEANVVREALSRVRAEVRTVGPWWRRLLGLMHPVSWLDVD
jgi:transglutaminase-like putative cysteine protease